MTRAGDMAEAFAWRGSRVARMLGTTLLTVLSCVTAMAAAPQQPGATSVQPAATASPQKSTPKKQKKAAASQPDAAASQADDPAGNMGSQIGVTTVTRETDSTATPGNAGELVDRVVAIINGDLVLESDVEEERRFAIFQPLSTPIAHFSRGDAIDRLINRTLIVQQLKLQPEPPISDDEMDQQILQLRKAIPECREAHCETDAGWAKFVEAQGFTMAEFRNRWRIRMEVLRFIEQRFRMGIRISPEQIKTYYDKTLLPQYAKQKVAPPKLDAISDRIQEVLLQQQVGSLLGDWLKSLRAQGQIRIPGQGSGAAQ